MAGSRSRRWSRSIHLAALGLVLCTTGLALADTRGVDGMLADRVKQKFIAAGYTSIAEFEADDGNSEGEGMMNGVKMQFHANPKTGALLSEKSDT